MWDLFVKEDTIEYDIVDNGRVFFIVSCMYTLFEGHWTFIHFLPILIIYYRLLKLFYFVLACIYEYVCLSAAEKYLVKMKNVVETLVWICATTNP